MDAPGDGLLISISDIFFNVSCHVPVVWHWSAPVPLPVYCSRLYSIQISQNFAEAFNAIVLCFKNLLRR